MKKRIITKRGTDSKEIEIGPLAWAEKPFLKHQEKVQITIPAGWKISLGRGTGSMIGAF